MGLNVGMEAVAEAVVTSDWTDFIIQNSFTGSQDSANASNEFLKAQSFYNPVEIPTHIRVTIPNLPVAGSAELDIRCSI